MKAFSEQLRECHNNGTAMIVSVPDIVCIKYKRICSSIVCKDERVSISDKYNTLLEKAKEIVKSFSEKELQEWLDFDEKRCQQKR